MCTVKHRFTGHRGQISFSQQVSLLDLQDPLGRSGIFRFCQRSQALCKSCECTCIGFARLIMISLARAAASIIFYRDKCYVATNIILSRPKVLSRQAFFCRDQHVCVGAKHVFCRDKSIFVATKIKAGERPFTYCLFCRGKHTFVATKHVFVATNIKSFVATKVLSRQKLYL